jgi:hypothetical protein
MSCIYILKLEDGKYYIGKSANVERRFADHMSGNGSAWTRKHPPIEIEKVIKNISNFDEDKFTKEYMAIHGINNVRGGSYVTLELSADQQKFLKREIWGAQDRCARCGDETHFISQCSKPITPLTPISIPKVPIEFSEDERSPEGSPEGSPESSPESSPEGIPVPSLLHVEVPPMLTIPNPVFVIKNWVDTTFSKLNSDLGRLFKL